MDAAERLGCLLHRALVLEHFEDARDHVFAQFLVGVLASAELERQLHLRAVGEELANLAQLVLQVARVRARMELDFLDLCDLLGLAGLLGLDGLVVLELSVVHDLAHGGSGIRSNLDEIESLLVGHALGLACRHHADHLSIGIQDAHLRRAYLEVDTRKLGDKAPLFS